MSAGAPRETAAAGGATDRTAPVGNAHEGSLYTGRQIHTGSVEAHHEHEQTGAVLNRLSRAIRHLESIRKMVEEDRDCVDVMLQLSAVKSAINQTGNLILQDHIGHCLADAVEHGDLAGIEEMNRAIDRFIK